MSLYCLFGGKPLFGTGPPGMGAAWIFLQSEGAKIERGEWSGSWYPPLRPTTGSGERREQGGGKNLGAKGADWRVQKEQGRKPRGEGSVWGGC